MPVSSIPLVLDKATPFWQILSSRWEVKLHSGERKMLEKPTPSDFRFQNLELFSQQKTMKIHFYIFYKLLTRELTSHILKNTLDGDIVGLLKGIYIYIYTWWRSWSAPLHVTLVFPVFRAFEDEVTRHVGRMHEVAIWQIGQKPHQSVVSQEVLSEDVIKIIFKEKK